MQAVPVAPLQNDFPTVRIDITLRYKIMNLSFGRRSISTLVPIWLATFAAAQAQITPFTTQPPPQSQAAPQSQSQSQQSAPATQGAVPALPGAQTSVDSIRPNYELGPSDQVMIHAPDAEELNDKTFRIEDDGTATLPLVGVVKMGGLTVSQIEDDLKNRLKAYVKNPVVGVTVVQFRSAPIFFVGQFQRPGIYALQGRHTLVEMMQSVGGLQPTAGRRIKITRKSESGPIPLGSAVEDPTTKTSSVEIGLVQLTENINPAEDIVLQPYDVSFGGSRRAAVYHDGRPGAGKQGGDRGRRSGLHFGSSIACRGQGGLAADAIPEPRRPPLVASAGYCAQGGDSDQSGEDSYDRGERLSSSAQ